MNKLEKSNNNEYAYVLDEFTKLLTGFLLKKETKPTFIGGIPVTLTKDRFVELFDKSYKYADYKYTATAKVDGTRYLCFITESSPSASSKTVYFIDRSMDIYNLISKNGIPFEKVNLPKMLLDGEMVFYKDKTGHFSLPREETDGLSFMVFDILFGPSDLYFRDIFTETEPHFKESVAMSGPIGGKIWDYHGRYTVLKKLFLPSNENNNLPPLAMKCVNSVFFRFELKNIISLKSFSDIKDIEKFVQKQFKDSRNAYYDFLIKKTLSNKLNTFNRAIRNMKVGFDGIIFTPVDTEYVFNTWNNYKNTLFKWKPSNEQTVDFKIKKIEQSVKIPSSDKIYIKAKLFFKRYDKKTSTEQYIEWVPGLNEPKFGLIPIDFEVEDGSVCEFTVDLENKYFIFSRKRELKGPNALLTIRSILEFIKNPVRINIIGRILTKEPSSDKTRINILTALADTLTKQQQIKLLICLDKIKFMDDNISNQLQSFIEELREPIAPPSISEEEKDKPYFKEMNEEMFRRQLKIIMEVPPSNELVVYLGRGISPNEFQRFEVMMTAINWNKIEVHEKVYFDSNTETVQRFFPELNDFGTIFSRKIKSAEELQIQTKAIVGSDIVFSKNRYTYINKIQDLSDYRVIVHSYKSIFMDPNGVINLVCEKRRSLVNNNGEISSPSNKNQITENINFEYIVYLQEANYYSVNFESIYNFIKFYLNF